MAIYCLFVFIITLYALAGIVELTAFAGSVFAVSFFGNLRWFIFEMETGFGAMISIVVGLLVHVLWRFIFPFEYDTLNDFHELFPAFTIAMLTYAIISLWSNKREPDSQHLALVSGKQ